MNITLERVVADLDALAQTAAQMAEQLRSFTFTSLSPQTTKVAPEKARWNGAARRPRKVRRVVAVVRTEAAAKKQPPPSATRPKLTAAQVLDAVAEHKGLTVAKASELFGVPETNIYFHFKTLRDKGQITKGADNVYRRVVSIDAAN